MSTLWRGERNERRQGGLGALFRPPGRAIPERIKYIVATPLCRRAAWRGCFRNEDYISKIPGKPAIRDDIANSIRRHTSHADRAAWLQSDRS